jgi:hypothetical protein
MRSQALARVVERTPTFVRGAEMARRDDGFAR